MMLTPTTPSVRRRKTLLLGAAMALATAVCSGEAVAVDPDFIIANQTSNPIIRTQVKSDDEKEWTAMSGIKPTSTLPLYSKSGKCRPHDFMFTFGDKANVKIQNLDVCVVRRIEIARDYDEPDVLVINGL
jgi:hypothetical protein